MKVILARHADAKNQDGVFHGMNDEPLTKDGKVEALKMGQKFAKFNPSLVITSTRRRSVDTGKAIARSLGIEQRAEKALDPLDLGEFVGKSTEEYTDDVKHFLENPDEQVPGGGTVREWADKYIPFFNKIYNHKGKDESVIFVTHGRNILLSKADLDTGSNNNNYNPKMLTDSDTSTEHAGYAIADPAGKPNFSIETPRKVKPGQS